MPKVQAWFLCFLPCALSFSDGDVRLVLPNVTHPLEGRVEIYHLGSWGTICDDYFGIEEANVVCRQLGYSLGAQYWYNNGHFGMGNGSIWLDDVNCVGNETKLINCNHGGWNNHNCHHYEDVGVVCLKEGMYSTRGTCDFEKGHGMCGYRRVTENSNFNWAFGSRKTGYNQWPKTDHTTARLRGKGFYMTTFMKSWVDVMQGQVARLQSPTISSAGCLEFYYFMGGTTVGELLVYLNTAEKEKLVWQLIGDQGYEWKKGVIPIDSKNRNFKIIFEGVAGTRFYGANDVAIDDIHVSSTTPVDCTTILPATAAPTPPVTPKKTIRLAGSSAKSAGRVEVFHDPGSGGRWGTVCSGLYRRTFDIHAATVVCKELGYEGAEMVVPCCQVFGKGTGRIWLDNVKCLGTEPSITMCSNSGWGNTYCTHDQDISVICKTNQTDRTEFTVRLGTDLTRANYEGRVEVKIGGIWGTVTDKGWDIYDANVVCKQLHFAGAVGVYTGSSFGRGKGPIWMSNFQCKGNENSLAKCNHTNTEVQEAWGHYRDASAECFNLTLADGGSNMSGRVKVMYRGRWGTVCNHNWDINAANVVCRQLGYRRAEAVRGFSKRSGQIFLDNVRCKGSEPSLSLCRHSGWRAHNCTQDDDDAGVVCTNAICGKSQPCYNGGTCNKTSGLCNCVASFVGELCHLPAGPSYSNGDIRLVGSSFHAEGRVEIYHLGSWGTICDDYFGIEEANVVCRQLGYSLGAQYWYHNAHFGMGNGSIWLDDVNCVGNETKLINCKHGGWNNHNCHHFEDVGVICVEEGNYSTPGTCDFEKGHGMCGYQRVTEKSNFNWTFGSRKTGYNQWPKTDHTTANLRGKGFYMTTFMKFWEDIMQGKVARLQSPTISSASCLEFYYFMGGTTAGELLVYLKTTEKEKLVWQLIGDQGHEWKKGVIPIDSKYRNFNIIFEGVAGTGFYGSDVAIDDILVSVKATVNCTLILPTTANPTPPGTPTKTIRLVGSSVDSAGRVEVYHNPGSKANEGKWGTVCSGSYRRTFDIKAATVVCKELGYEGAEMVVPCCQVFGKGTGHIWLDNVKCLGTEPSITVCSNSGWGNTYCTHNQDISVICKTKQTDRTEFAVRLGTDLTRVNYKGRVEVNIGGIWGTVTDKGWDFYDANVVCKQLHFAGAVGVYTGSSFGRGKGPIWMSDFQCKGNENSLAKCNHSNTEVQEAYGHYRDASVECFDLRLANGPSNMSGRVEVMYSGRWGTVCNHNWNINAGNVVCRQLGYRRAEAVASFGAGSGQIFMDKVQCKGFEPSLSLCYFPGWYASNNCTHGQDAGVVCTNMICGKSQSCLNGGTCNKTSGLCNCVASFVGELCQLPAENKTVEVVFDGKLKQWNETWFKHILVKDLNTYCSKVDCSAALSKRQKIQLTFEDDDIDIVEQAKQQDQGFMVGFVVLYTDGMNTEVMPKSFMHDFISSRDDNLAGFKVIMVDGQNEGSPAGHHSAATQQKSKSKYIYIGVGLVLALVAVLVLVFVVKRYGRKLQGRIGGGSGYSDRSYLALHSEDYDDSMDDSVLLRPPQEPSGEGDLMS